MSIDAWWLTYPLIGAVVGYAAGLLGIGGGGLMVPLLTTLFVAQGFPQDKIVHMALGTSMAAIVTTSIASMRAHHSRGAVRWDIVRAITPGIVAGTFGATFLAAYLDSKPLAIFFAVFMFAMSVQMILNIKPEPTRELPGPVGTAGVGLVIGGTSALVAIGGGSLSVPFMTWCNVRIQVAIGTAAAIGFPIALAGTAGYIVNGWNMAGTPPLSFGFIYLPALVLITTVSALTAPLGAQLAHRLPVTMLKKLFAVLLVLLSLKMLHSLFGS